jgi:hypothetical protein
MELQTSPNPSPTPRLRDCSKFGSSCDSILREYHLGKGETIESYKSRYMWNKCNEHRRKPVRGAGEQ